MKICYDTLEGVYLSSTGNFRKGSHIYIIAVCDVCNEEYMKRIDTKGNSCTKSCAGTVKRHTEETKQRIAKAHRGKVLSIATRKKIAIANIGNTKHKGHKHSKEVREKMSKAQRGKNNWRYNPSITDEERAERRDTVKYKNWVSDVKLLHSTTCVNCKSFGKIVHHKESYADNPSLRYDIENGITLCKSCHKDFHKEFGYGNNTKEQLYYWLLENKTI